MDELSTEYPIIERNSFVRWVRPIVSIMKFVDILSDMKLSKYNLYAKNLQESYLKKAKSFGVVIPIELVEAELRKIDSSFNIVSILNKILENLSLKFKIELLMMPDWASKSRNYKINQDVYTHIKIKSDLLKED